MNSESILSKLPWNELKQNEIFKAFYVDTSIDAVLKSALDNPENTGIDINDDLSFYVQKDSIGGYVVLLGKVKDADKFKSFFSSATKGNLASGRDGENSLSNDKMIASWNKERFSVIFDAPQMRDVNMNNMSMPGMDTSIMDRKEPIVSRNMKAISEIIFDLEEKNSLAKDEKFTDLLNKKGDLHFWFNSGDLGSQAAGMGAMRMMNLSKLYEDAIVAGTATFMDGKIDMEIKSYAGKEMSNLFKKYQGSKINTEMLERIPSKDMAVLFAMNFKPEGLLEFIKIAGMEGFVNMGAGYLGFTTDDFVKANKGDILFTVTGLTKDTTGKPSADLLFSASINDKVAFDKLIEAGKKAGKSNLTTGLPTNIFYNTTGTYFAIGNKQSTVDTYINSESKSNIDYLNKITGSPLGLFINFQYILRNSTPSNTDSLNTAAYNASVQMWDNLFAKGGEFKDGGIVQQVEINLVDKKMNSLKQLNNYFGILGSLQKKKSSTKNIRGNDSLILQVDTTFAFGPGN
jgi:hypothetical protein